MPYSQVFQEKVTEAASIILHHAGGSISYLSLVKLIYLADRRALELWEKPITYDTFASLPLGPVGSNTCNLARGISTDSTFWGQYIETFGKDVRIKSEYPKIKKLSPDEINLIEEIYSKYGHMGKYELARFTEKLPEWKNPGKSSFPIELRELLNILNFNKEDSIRIESEIQQDSELDALLSV
jgi:uncharacterized phage-associated protein